MDDQILARAIATYGVNNQLTLSQEEAAELIEALSVLLTDPTAGYPMLLEEAADVLIMLRQVEMILDAREAIEAQAGIVPMSTLVAQPVEILARFIRAVSKMMRGKSRAARKSSKTPARSRPSSGT